MDVVATLAGILVGLTLLISGGVKLTDRTWPAQARGIGAPSWAVPVVPLVELALGAVMAAGLFQPWSGLATVALLVSFTALIVRRLAEGDRPPCACFGRLTTKPIGPASLVRNAVLIGLTLIASFA